jgi:hypothetical protein
MRAEVTMSRLYLDPVSRNHLVPPGVVREIVVETAAFAEVDVVAIATNSRFSNDTRDWLAEWIRSHPRPAVLLWDREALERMLTQHPSGVARVAPVALSLDGQLAGKRRPFRTVSRHRPPGSSCDLAAPLRNWIEQDQLDRRERDDGLTSSEHEASIGRRFTGNDSVARLGCSGRNPSCDVPNNRAWRSLRRRVHRA